MQLFLRPFSSRSPRRPNALFLFALASWVAACEPGSKVGEDVTVDEGAVQGTGGGGGSGPEMPPLGETPREQMLYELPPPPGCGDFELNDDEVCDDGNLDNFDGCAGNCLLVEAGYQCGEPGTPCTRAEICGDGVLVGAEACDDGNADPDDGCASNCQLEAGYTCPEPDAPCESFVICGDGVVVLSETCDDGNATAGDGCSDTCQLENGYQCLIANAKCSPVCGDGQLIANERCDDRNTNDNDGCDQNCRLEPNSVCRVPGEPCEDTVCQDGVEEGSEQCDDDNALPYDGCTETCTNEPVCRNVGANYVCEAVCGDGMKFPEEACDDGNNDADDGCSPTCETEDGYDCTDAAPALGNALALPVIIRDFSAGHPQFEIDPLGDQRLPGIVQNRLVGSPGKPVYNAAYSFNGKAWTMDGPDEAGGQFANEAGTLTPAQIATRFSEWYNDVPGQNITLLRTLNFTLQAGSFVFSATGATQFFPIDGAGFGNETNGDTNFHFTSEVRQWFQSEGGEVLEFRGDDDVWVFVNGQLTVDLGGIHSEIGGSIELGGVGETSELCVQEIPTNDAITCTNINVPISPNVNEIVVFQAERHVTLSNYTLSLRGFSAPVTSCQSDCGDGILTPDETCDEGPANGSGYERCRADCTPGPRCGDGIVDAGEEECDNGFNRDGYFVNEDSCAPGCVLPSACGDGVIDALFDEQCDDGVNDNSYGGCNSQCQLGPRCGDGTEDDEEECDDGNRRNNDGCNVNCAIERDPE